ncbi:MAG: NAD+ synthase, partial [Acidimicrobiia bacterium]|nr:NAD+ synthase [Acidimicrobiia bacterium]
MLRVGICQLNLTVGDLDGNVERMLAALAEVTERGGDVAVFPELAVSGYPPEDLLAKPRFALDCQAALEKIAAATGRCAAVVGLPTSGEGGKLFNAAAVCADGATAGVERKAHLPNYGVFDEKRHFSAGTPEALFDIAGVAVGISICEDIWIDGGAVEQLVAGGAELIINLNASPYNIGKLEERLGVLRRRIERTGCPVVYVNLVGGQDELLFDGRSLVLGAGGSVTAQAQAFAEEVLVVDVEVGCRGGSARLAGPALRRIPVSDRPAVMPAPLPPTAPAAPLEP